MKTACGTKSRLCEVIVASSVLVLTCGIAQAQPQQQSHRSIGRPMGGPPHGPPPSQNMGPPHGPPGQNMGPPRGPSGQSIRDRWLAMPPEARQNFRRNAERWMRMSPEERNVMRQRENLLRATVKRETDSALRESGANLNPQERAQFESRYMQERRKVEQTLRQQIEAERQKELPALIQQLKKEFQIDQPTRNPAAKQADSVNPKK
ncbi:MAG TPA: hypothetical protein VH227_02595 [Candidatus Udaeobacter sp.]|nr:hypothetical protein [Candidatus Udaeobacter sp.]